MQGISINGYYLHEIKMLMVPDGAIRLLSYSKHKMQFEIVGDKLFLNIPTFVALELYRRAIFPQDPSKSVSIKISGKEIGRFLILDLRYPNDYENYVSMTLQREKQQKR